MTTQSAQPMSRGETQYEKKELPTGDNWIRMSPNELQWKENSHYPGMHFAVLANDQTGFRCMARITKGVKEPIHAHSARMEWMLISGRVRASNPRTNQSVELTPGTYWHCPANSPHSVEALEDAIGMVILHGNPDFLPFGQSAAAQRT